jgi:hypothetical protein
MEFDRLLIEIKLIGGKLQKKLSKRYAYKLDGA